MGAFVVAACEGGFYLRERMVSWQCIRLMVFLGTLAKGAREEGGGFPTTLESDAQVASYPSIQACFNG